MAHNNEHNGGGGGSNTQYGLVNLNFQPKFNFYNSGGAAATTSLATSSAPLVLKGLAKTAFGQSIPVVGQIVSVVTGVITIVQMFNTQAKAQQLALTIQALRKVDKALKQEIDIQLWGANELIALNNTKIEHAQESLQTKQILMYVTGGILMMSSMAFVYGIKKIGK